MKRITLILVIGFVLAAMVSLPAQNKTDRPQRPKVGVVLGGGGAKGASHIGVLKYLEEMGIPIDYVAGTSMGSIIGGFYAMGYSPDELTQLISSMDWSAYIGNKIDRPMMSEEAKLRNSTLLLQIPFSLESLFEKDPNASFISQLPSAYVNNSSLINLFNDLCVGYQEEMDFNDLPIPFACVATNIVTGEEVVLRSGSVPTAMRASMAIPGVFSPVTIGDMVLVDGGLANNFPADVLREMGADIIIGVEVTSEKKVTQKDIQSLPQLLGRLVINGTSAKRKENREICDIRIVPDVSGFGMLSFTPEAIDTLVGRGYRKAAIYHDQLAAIKQLVEKANGGPVGKELHAPKSLNLTDHPVLISKIDFDGVTDQQSRWLIRKGRLKTGVPYSKEEIEQVMSLYRGTGCFDEITYNIKECDSTHNPDRFSDNYALSIHMKPAKPHLFAVGLRYDTEEGAGILIHVGLNEKKFNGSKLNFNAKMSYNPHLNLTYTYSRSSLANFNLSFDYRNDHFKWMLGSYQGLNPHYQQLKASGYISQFHLKHISTTLGASYTYTSFDITSLEEGNSDSLFFGQNTLLTPFLTIKYDNLDNAYFAKHGIFAQLSGKYHFDMKDKEGRYRDISYAFQSYITPVNGRLTIIPQVYGLHRSFCRYFNLWSLFGGEIPERHFEGQLPFIGLASVATGDDNIGILRCDLRYNLYGKHYLTAMYNYLFSWSSMEGLSSLFGMHGAGLKYSYDSFLGPISLTAHWANEEGSNRFGAYFSFGYTF